MKTDDGDVLHLRRQGKNHSSLFQNILTCLKGGGMLIPMIVRGTGAALTVAGQYPLPSSNPNAFREAPTHIVSSGQEVDNPTCLVIAECVHHRICVNVFIWNFVQQKSLKGDEDGRWRRPPSASGRKEPQLSLLKYSYLSEMRGHAHPNDSKKAWGLL